MANSRHPHDLGFDHLALFGESLVPGGHLARPLGVGQLLRLDESLLLLAHLLGHRQDFLDVVLEPLDALFKHGHLARHGIRALVQLDHVGLNLGQAFVVLSALLNHVGQRAGAVIQVFGDVGQRLAQHQQHLAQPLVLGLACHQFLVDAPETWQLFTNFRNAARQLLALGGARAFVFALAMQARFALARQHDRHFILELLQGLLQLQIARQLRLRAGQPAFQFLNAPAPAPDSL